MPVITFEIIVEKSIIFPAGGYFKIWQAAADIIKAGPAFMLKLSRRKASSADISPFLYRSAAALAPMG